MDKGNIFSVSYKDYQNKRQNLINNQNDNRRNNVDNLTIENNDDFNNVIKKKLDDIKNNTTKKFDNFMNKYKISFEEYKKNIFNYLETTKKNISNTFVEQENNNEILYNFIYKNIFKKLNNLLEIYDNIINNIEDNFDLLNKYLTQNEMINSKNPLEQFLIYYDEGIINSSIISKYKFDEINPLNIMSNKYYRYYFSYLNEDKKNLPIKILSIYKDNKVARNDAKSLKEYFTYKSLRIKSINSAEFQVILDAIPSNKTNLVKLDINNFDLTIGFPENKLNNDKLNGIQKLKIHNGKYLNNVILTKILLNKGESLISLSLEKINMTDMGRKKLFNYFYSNEKILENIQFLSLSGNKITSISEAKKDIEEKDPNEKDPTEKKIFKKLQIFNLSKNEMYKFEMGNHKFPELKLLDLSSNTIPTGAFMETKIKEEKNTLYLFNDNIFITNNSENNKVYIDYINKKFPLCNYDLKKINLRFTYDIENQNNLENLKFSPTTRISLIKLDLSYCGLSTDVIIKFLKNNFGLLSLKNLQLKYNNIKNDFFEKIVCDEIILNNLDVLNLNYNEIPCKKVEDHNSLIKFIKNFTNLTRIKLKNSNFYNNWILSTSPDYDNTQQFTKLYVDLVIYLKKNNRKFIFAVDNNNNIKLDEKFREIFRFYSE